LAQYDTASPALAGAAQTLVDQSQRRADRPRRHGDNREIDMAHQEGTSALDARRVYERDAIWEILVTARADLFGAVAVFVDEDLSAIGLATHRTMHVAADDPTFVQGAVEAAIRLRDCLAEQRRWITPPGHDLLDRLDALAASVANKPTEDAFARVTELRAIFADLAEFGDVADVTDLSHLITR
jgi:hypothetical protein